MESLEEITPLQVKEMTRDQAKGMWDARADLIQRLRQEMQMLEAKAFPPGKPAPIIDADAQRMEAGWRKKIENPKVPACPECGGTDLMPQKGNRFFCRQCSISFEGT